MNDSNNNNNRSALTDYMNLSYMSNLKSIKMYLNNQQIWIRSNLKFADQIVDNVFSSDNQHH